MPAFAATLVHLAVVSLALAAPLVQRSAVSGSITATYPDGTTSQVGDVDSTGAFTLASPGAIFTLPAACPSGSFAIASPSTLLGAAVSSSELRNGPSVDQAAAVHDALRNVRYASYNLSAAIVLEAVQKVRRDAAATVSSIRHSDYDAAAADLANMEAGWSTPYTASQNSTIFHWFDNAQGAASEAFKADYFSCAAAKAAVVQTNVTETIAESAIEHTYLPGDYASAAAALADKVAKIAAAYNDTQCINYTAPINNSLSPASTDVLANNTTSDFVLSEALAVIAAQKLEAANLALTAAQSTADSSSAAFTNFTSSASSETSIFSLDCASNTLSARYTNQDGSAVLAQFFNNAGHLALSGHVSSTNYVQGTSFARVVLSFTPSA